MQLKVAYIKAGSFSHVNENLIPEFIKRFPDFEVVVIDVVDLVLSRKVIVFINLFFVLKEFGFAILLGKRKARRSFFVTTYIFKKIKHLVAEQVSKDDYCFSFQTQSLFDASVEGVPHFVYTDHTIRALLNYSGMSQRDVDWMYTPPWVAMEKSIYHNASLNFTTSHFARQSLIVDYGCDLDQVVCVYSGINIPAGFVPGQNQHDQKRILFVGIEWERKGGPELVRAFRLVLEVHPDAQLMIVGCSPDLDLPNCQVVGRVPRKEIGRYYEEATVFCLPSRIEPSAVALVEASAWGLPVVATESGGTVDRVLDGETGYLVKPGDVEGMANVLIELLENPAQCRAFGENGYRLAMEKFTWTKVADMIEEKITPFVAQRTAKKPRVSIGMPVYNGERYIEETIDCLLDQTFTDFEIIISDNASTDRTPEICRAYAAKDPRIRYYRNKQNLGAAPNYNRAFELSSGDYFKWAAYDDLCAPEFLERCVSLLDSEPEAIMCYPKTVLINEEGNVHDYMPDYEDRFNLRSPYPHQRFRLFFDIGDQCHPVFGLIRRHVLEKTILIGSFSSSDRLLLGELALTGKCYEIPERLAFRRLHGQNSVSTNKTHRQMTRWFDKRTGKIVLGRRQRLLWEYVRAIMRVRLSWWERLLCYGELLRFSLLALWKKKAKVKAGFTAGRKVVTGVLSNSSVN